MTFASDVDAAEKGTEACTPPSNQRGLAPEPRQCRTSVGTSQSRGVLGDGESVQTNARECLGRLKAQYTRGTDAGQRRSTSTSSRRTIAGLA